MNRLLVSIGAAVLIIAGSIGTAAAAGPAAPTRVAPEATPTRVAPGATASTRGTPVPIAPTRPATELHRFCTAEWRALAADRTIETFRAVGACEINRRLVTLDQLDRRVAAAPQFTERHKHQLRLVNDINPASYEAERSGLRALKAKIDAETDLTSLRGLIADIAEEFRVYVLVVPRTHLVGGADAADQVIERLTHLTGKLQDLIDRVKSNGQDVMRAQALLDGLVRKTHQADGLVSPVVGMIMPLSPADWNDGIAGPKLAAARQAIQQARELLRGARADAQQIIDLLRP